MRKADEEKQKKLEQEKLEAQKKTEQAIEAAMGAKKKAQEEYKFEYSNSLFGNQQNIGYSPQIPSIFSPINVPVQSP